MKRTDFNTLWWLFYTNQSKEEKKKQTAFYVVNLFVRIRLKHQGDSVGHCKCSTQQTECLNCGF